MNYELFQHPDTHIFLVDMSKELNHYFSEIVDQSIRKQLREGKKIGIMVNKKGYSQGIICHHCGHIPQCKKCSVAISYHKQLNGEMIGLCHICKTQYNFPHECPHCHSKEIKNFGLGTQQVAEIMKREYQTDAFIIESERLNSPSKIKNATEEIQNAEYQVIVGTSLLSQPIREYPLDVIIFLNADIGLNIPDFKASENNFNLLYETFTKHQTKHFIVQSFNPDQHSLRFACKLDAEGFYEKEHAFRKEYSYPPFADLCVILYKNEIEEKVFKKVDTLHKDLLYLAEKYEMKDLEIYSTPPLIYKMFGKYRYNIIIKGKNVRNFMDIVYSKLNLNAKGFKINWDADTIV